MSHSVPALSNALNSKSDAIKSNYSIKFATIRYFPHLPDARLFRCGFPDFNSIATNFGLYLPKHLFYTYLIIKSKIRHYINRFVNKKGQDSLCAHTHGPWPIIFPTHAFSNAALLNFNLNVMQLSLYLLN